MTVRNMAQQAMMNGSLGGINPLFGKQNLSLPTLPKQSENTPSLPAGAYPGFTTSATMRDAGNNLLGAVQGKSTEFSQYQGATSNAQTATVSIDNARMSAEAKAALASQPMELSVSQTATAQVNAGQALDKGASAAAAGEHSFSIEVGGKTHSFQISVSASDTNEDVQKKMAELINKADIGISANITTDDKTGTTALSLTSTSTGTDQAFTVRDVQGNLASSMGVSKATQQAQNAIYSANGGPQVESQSNNISLAKGVNVTLTGSGSTSVSATRETGSAMAAAGSMVDALNSALKAANSGEGRGSTRFANDIHALIKRYSSQMALAGINVSKNGELSIDQTKMEKAAANGSLDRLMNNERIGLGAEVERIGQNAVSTDKYADSQLGFNFNRGQLNFFNVNNTGWLFNMYL